ncbi:unnamed protein product [Adineta steineri]|uniref:Uncharacterized protein n=1 Tax=Adineta steineri TaxID=433720 RepID=A0A814WGA7_9BILA|nr:unnamed protein product [Adineta steineri]CAF1556534.1 unnamed protein product [Adineta steineri]
MHIIQHDYFFSALIAIPTIASHSCSSTGPATITGSLCISKADFALLSTQKESFESCFTNQLRLSSSLNIGAIFQVHGFEQLANGDCQVSYGCSGVGHQPSALTCLKATPDCDDFKTILGKCCHSSGAIGGGLGIGLQAGGGLLGGLLNLGSSLIGGLLAAVSSHTCLATGPDAITGSLCISNADFELLSAQQDSFESCFTSQLQASSPLNNKATWKVQKCEKLANGDCQVSYTCSGVGHQPSAQTCLKATPNCDAFKTILGKCCHSHGDNIKSSMSSNTTLINYINYLSSDLDRYLSIGILLLGTIRNILNCLALSQQPLCSNPCVLFFLASSIASIITLISGVLVRLLSG